MEDTVPEPPPVIVLPTTKDPVSVGLLYTSSLPFSLLTKAITAVEPF